MKEFGAVYSRMCESFSYFIVIVIAAILGFEKQEIQYILFIFVLTILTLIYIEIIELKFCGLNKNVKIRIVERERRESIILEDIELKLMNAKN